MATCDRCGKDTILTMCSMFNTEMCCQECLDKEKRHPSYELARFREFQATQEGNFDFPGIGLPPDLCCQK